MVERHTKDKGYCLFNKDYAKRNVSGLQRSSIYQSATSPSDSSAVCFTPSVGQEPLLDTIYNGAPKVGCSGCVFGVLRKLGDELVTLSCPRVAEVQVRYGLRLNALQAGISRSAASAFPHANW
jgi:hypothetical protein